MPILKSFVEARLPHRCQLQGDSYVVVSAVSAVQPPARTQQLPTLPELSNSSERVYHSHLIGCLCECFALSTAHSYEHNTIHFNFRSPISLMKTRNPSSRNSGVPLAHTQSRFISTRYFFFHSQKGNSTNLSFNQTALRAFPRVDVGVGDTLNSSRYTCTEICANRNFLPIIHTGSAKISSEIFFFFNRPTQRQLIAQRQRLFVTSRFRYLSPEKG